MLIFLQYLKYNFHLFSSLDEFKVKKETGNKNSI